MKLLKAILILAVNLFILSLVSYADAVATSEAMKLFSGPVLFKDLISVVPHAAMAFSAFAWIIFMFAVLGKLQRGEFEQNPAFMLAKIIIAMACIVGSTAVFDQGLKLAEGLSDAISVPQQNSLANKMFNIFHTMESAQESATAQEERYREAKNIKETMPQKKGLFGDAQAAVVNEVAGFFTNLLVKGVVSLISMVLWFCSWVLTIVDTARYFLVQICSLIFPIFVAGLLTQSFSAQSYSFIFNVIGLFLWPVGWSIGHLGTHALFAAAANVMHVEAIVVSDSASKTAEGLQNAIGNGVYDPNVTTDGISCLASLGMGPLMCFIIMMLVTCIWILAVTFKAPHFIQQLVVAGGAGFSSMLSGMGVVTAAVGGVVAQTTGASKVARHVSAMPNQVGDVVVGSAASIARSAASGVGSALAASNPFNHMLQGGKLKHTPTDYYSSSQGHSSGNYTGPKSGQKELPTMAELYQEYKERQKREALVAARYAKANQNKN